MGVGLAIIGWVQEFLQNWMQALNQVDLSVREGKALELLKDRLIRLPGVEEVNVDDRGPRIQNGGSPIITIAGTAAETMTPETQHIIKMVVAKVNMRYGTTVTVRFAKQSGPRS